MKTQNRIKQSRRAGYIFITPAIIFFAVFIAYPILFICYGSLFSWSTLSNMKYVGFNNYIKLFQDGVFGVTLKNSLYWILITITIQAVVGFILAYIIEENLTKFKSFFRTLYFIPVVTSIVVIAIVFKNMFSPYQGLITNIIYDFGVKGPLDWLGNVNTAIFAIIVVNIWEWTGWSMLLYIAGISQIPEEIKEAAEIDGANGFRKIANIFLPMLSGVHKSLVMLGIIGSLQTFALVYNMTNGGPNSASEMPGTYIFRMGFKVQQMGYASAISVIILIIALILTVVQVLALGSGNFIGKGGAKK
ncbi:MAG: putative ABC-type sugar transport system, permease component [Clostridiales bacterium]|nr:putative ABC-type sugar transport system, permease component [Clostridiales bacterium]